MHVCRGTHSFLLFRWNNRQNIFRLYSDPEVDPLELADTHTLLYKNTHTQKWSICDFLGLVEGMSVLAFLLPSTVTDSQPNYLYGMVNIISIDSQNYSMCVHMCVARTLMLAQLLEEQLRKTKENTHLR